jgi:hypothetical protein
MNDHETVSITGRIYSPEYFRINEFTTIDPREIVRVMRGEVAGCIFRGAMAPDLCQGVTKNFWASPELRQRGDAVPAYYVGTYHYAKTLQTYVSEADQTREALHALFDGHRNVFQELMDQVAAELASSGVTLRVAEHEGRAAGEFVVRAWSGGGSFALAAHDDAAQLSAPAQAGFEIQQVAGNPLAAANMCLQNGAAGGQLFYWNIEPDVPTRRALGLEETGYPYQPEWLDQFDCIELDIRPGDIYFFNGKLIHAVQAQAAEGEFRSTISFLMGIKDDQTALYWT